MRVLPPVTLALPIQPFRVEFEPSVAAELKRLTTAQQRSVDRKVAAAAQLASLREHPGGEEWLEITTGPVVLECRADDRRRVLTVVGVRPNTARRR